MAPQTTTPRPLSSRGLDQFYFLFLCHMIPVIIFSDSLPFIPTSIRPAPLTFVYNFYTSTFHDPLAIQKPSWYAAFVASDVFIQLPLAVWAVGALRRDSPLVPLGVGAYALMATLTTWTCVWALMTWDEKELGWGDKRSLGAMFGAYGVVFTAMMVDMGLRIKERLLVAAKREGRRKGK